MQPNFALVVLSSFRVVIDGLQGAFPEGGDRGNAFRGSVTRKHSTGDSRPGRKHIAQYRFKSLLTAVHLTPFTTAASAPQSITGVLSSTTYSAFN